VHGAKRTLGRLSGPILLAIPSMSALAPMRKPVCVKVFWLGKFISAESQARKDDRLDTQALARLARINPRLLSPIQHRSAQATRRTLRAPRSLRAHRFGKKPVLPTANACRFPALFDSARSSRRSSSSLPGPRPSLPAISSAPMIPQIEPIGLAVDPEASLSGITP